MKKLAVLLVVLLSATIAQAQTDSIGVYAVLGSSTDRLEILNYTATKVNSGFMKAKAKLEFNGATSANQFKNGATFRMYFGMPSPHDVARYYMFTQAYSAKDFAVGKFEVKKDKRYLTTAVVSIAGSKAGADNAKDLTVVTRKIRANVYEIIVSGPAGEYCIMPMINGSAGYSGVFDFTLTE